MQRGMLYAWHPGQCILQGLQTNNAAETDADADGAVTYPLVANFPIPDLQEGGLHRLGMLCIMLRMLSMPDTCGCFAAN